MGFAFTINRTKSEEEMKNEYSETFYISGDGDQSVGINPWTTKVEIIVSQLPCDREIFEDSLKEYLICVHDEGLNVRIETRTERDAREAIEDEQWEAERAAGLVHEPQIIGLKDVFQNIFGRHNE